MPRTTKFQTYPVKTTGSSYQNSSIPISSQRTFNLYPEATPEGITQSALKRWPGLSLFDPNFSSTPCKFLYFWQNKIYTAYDGQLWEFSYTTNLVDGYIQVGGNPVSVGVISGPAQIYSVSDNGIVMVIATGGTMYQYDGSAVSTISSVYWSPKFVQFNNERFITDGDDGGNYVSDVLSTNFDISNVFYTRASTDTAVGPYVFNQIVYGFGQFSVEPWSDIGVGAPPYSRISEGIIDTVGTYSMQSVANTENYMYFMGSDAIAYRVNSFSAEAVSNTVISTHFRSLTYQNCKADAFVHDGQHFIAFTFYNDAQTWVFSEDTGAWFEIGGADGTAYPAFSFIQGPLNRVYCCSYEEGSIYYLRQDSPFNPYRFMQYERVISVISGDDFGVPQGLLEMSKLYLSVETGGAIDPNEFPSTSLTYGNPIMIVQPSFDGGYTWDKEYHLRLGTRGQFSKPVELHLMKQFRRALFRIKVTDPLENFAIYSAAIDIRQAGS